jgi:hypothetical protein
MPRLALVPAVAALALATACTEDSSFVMRWQVARSVDELKELDTVRQCSELGISHVRVTTLDAAGDEVDTREFPCFPESFRSDGAAPGPEVGPGDYYVTMVGLTRRGFTRPVPNSQDPDEVVARDNQKVHVNTTGEGVLAAFKLIGADECNDGIDNDRDGGVDRGDLACRQGEVREDLDSAATLFTLSATLLDENPAATCSGLGLTSLRVTLDDDAGNAQNIPCSTDIQAFSAYLAAGEHTWTVVGLNSKGVEVTKQLTGAEPFTVTDTGAVVDIRISLGLEVFLADPPFSEPLRFSIEYQPYPESPVDRPCDADELDLGQLRLGATRVTVFDDTGAPVDTLTLTEVVPGFDDIFPIFAGCYDFQRVRATSELVWAPVDGQRDYTIGVQTWANGVDPDGPEGPCFSSLEAPARLAPGISPGIVVPRVRTDGVCADCVPCPAMDAECVEACSRCEDGVCKL